MTETFPYGHEGVLDARDPAKLAGWAEENVGGRVGSFAEAAAFGEVARPTLRSPREEVP